MERMYAVCNGPFRSPDSVISPLSMGPHKLTFELKNVNI